MLRDRRIIFTASFLRAVANGLIGVLAGIYLAQLGLDPAAWGAVLGAGIAGTAVRGRKSRHRNSKHLSMSYSGSSLIKKTATSPPRQHWCLGRSDSFLSCN